MQSDIHSGANLTGEILVSRDAFRGLYRAYFDKAEAKRRWKLHEDIPWEAVKRRSVEPELVDVLEAFYATEPK